MTTLTLIIGLVIWLIGYIWLGSCAYRVKKHKLYKAEQRVIANDIFWAAIAVSVGSMLIGSTVGR